MKHEALMSPASSCLLSHLDLSGNDLSSVEPQHLARAATHLHQLRIATTNLTLHQVNTLVPTIVIDTPPSSLTIVPNIPTTATVQVTVLFSSLAQEGSRLRSLSVRRASLSPLPVPVLLQGLASLQEVDLGLTGLTGHQLEALLLAVARGRLALRSLGLSGLHLDEVEPGLLARVVSRLERLVLKEASLTKPQVEEVKSAWDTNRCVVELL